jgi:serine phosphatase RsbU (regulator of sigma subunit)/anti-sigma regulatory factor (Ser/Thr protein kinase)/putative flippase GtrA
MELTGLNIFKVVLFILIPIILTCLFLVFDKETKFNKLNNKLKQVIIGLVFSLYSISSILYGIRLGTPTSLFNSQPLILLSACYILTCGFVFSKESGVLVGLITLIFRLSVYNLDSNTFTYSADCIYLGVLIVLVYILKRFVFDNKTPTFFHGFIITTTLEILHLLLITLCNLAYSSYAHIVICDLALVSILSNSISVSVAIICSNLINKEHVFSFKKKKTISQVFQIVLMSGILVALAITTTFTYSVQKNNAISETEKLLEINAGDIENDTKSGVDDLVLNIIQNIANQVGFNPTSEQLEEAKTSYDVSELSLISKDGIVVNSTDSSMINYDYNSGEQSQEFLNLFRIMSPIVQEYRATSKDPNVYMKYSGVRVGKYGLIMGLNTTKYKEKLDSQIYTSIKNRHIRQNGGVIFFDENGKPKYDFEGKYSYQITYTIDSSIFNKEAYKMFEFDINYGSEEISSIVTNYGIYLKMLDEYILLYVPVSEIITPIQETFLTLIFIEIIVFISLFIIVYALINNFIIKKINKVESSLHLISNGNLDVNVDVKGNQEFESLSNNINSTVTTLKGYIQEAETRMDKELELARQIQLSSLPSIFPPYPERKDFDIYASMKAAKEVGGDFYDFYLLDNQHIVFLIADVSGKGIPASLFMMKAKTIIKNLFESGLDIEQVAYQSNKHLCENNDAEMFVTSFMAVLDLKTGILEYVNAGHNNPLICKNGKYEYIKTRPNFVLAGMNNIKYKKQEIKLEIGDKFFLYTDGVTEARNNKDELYGETKLLFKLNNISSLSTKDTCISIQDELNKFMLGADQADDITLLCIQFNGNNQTNQLVVNTSSESTQQVLDYVEQEMTNLGFSLLLINKTQILVDEIYSNFVKYSSSNKSIIEVSKIENKVRLLFKNDGIPFDPTKTKAPDVSLNLNQREEGGLGILIIKKTASKFEYKYKDNLNVITLELE